MQIGEILVLWLSQLPLYPIFFIVLPFMNPVVAIPYGIVAIFTFYLIRRRPELNVFLPAWAAVFVLPTTSICGQVYAVQPWILGIYESVTSNIACQTGVSLTITLGLNFMLAHVIRLTWAKIKNRKGAT